MSLFIATQRKQYFSFGIIISQLRCHLHRQILPLRKTLSQTIVTEPQLVQRRPKHLFQHVYTKRRVDLCCHLFIFLLNHQHLMLNLLERKCLLSRFRCWLWRGMRITCCKMGFRKNHKIAII